MNQLRIPPWLRPRDAAELKREREHLERMRWYERLAVLAGWKIRPVEKEQAQALVARAENAERALEEADERHGRYVKAVGELAGMAARIQDAQRYRWLVGQNDPIIWDYLGGMDDDQIDEAIDKWIADDAHLSRKEKQT